MVQIKLGLSKKITVLCIIMAVVICIGVCCGGFFTFRNALYDTYNEFAYQLANTAASFVDGNTITDYLEGREIDDEYEEMADQIYNLFNHNALTSIYISTVDAEELTTTTIFDARVREAPDPERFKLGVIDHIGTKDPTAPIRLFETGEPVEYYFIRMNDFGYNTSAIIPIKDDSGTPTALLIVDMPMPTIIDRLISYLWLTISITMVLVVIMMAFNLSFLRRNVIGPIRNITLNAASFASSRKSFSESISELKTGDEIETLAKALVKMESDITQYIDNLAKVTAERERISAELDVATQIQKDMLPGIFPPYPECDKFDIYATMNPAKEVGGDFYDFFLIDDNHLGLVMADVSGKGVPAALFMVISKTLLKNNAQSGVSPKTVMEAVNRQLCENNDASMFVTVWFGILDLSTGKVTAVNAGHEKPLLKRKGGDFEFLRDKHGLMLAAMETSKYTEYEIQLNPGDQLFLYTDGLLEATDASETLYGEERALVSLNSHKDEGLAQFLTNVRKDVDAFVGSAPQFDDLTMLILNYYG